MRMVEIVKNRRVEIPLKVTISGNDIKVPKKLLNVNSDYVSLADNAWF